MTRTTSTATPLATTPALPAASYIDATLAERERHAIFARSWQLAGFTHELDAGPRPFEIAGVPLWLLRDGDGRLRALHDVCRHRAGPLAPCTRRGETALRCRYHGWTYATDGRLVTAPEMDGVEGFDPATIRLPEARIADWQGLLFVALEPAIALDELLAGITDRLGRSLEVFRFHRRIGYDIACDWKVYLDNYLEGYHIPHIHPALNRMIDYRSYAVDLGRWHSLQHSPLESGPALYGSGEALYFTLWPNTLLNVLPDRLQLNRVLPLGPGRCRVEFDYAYPADADPDDLPERHAADHHFSDEVQQEDVEMCERVQRNLASGSYIAGPLNPRREQAVAHFQALWREAMAKASA